MTTPSREKEREGEGGRKRMCASLKKRKKTKSQRRVYFPPEASRGTRGQKVRGFHC